MPPSSYRALEQRSWRRVFKPLTNPQWTNQGIRKMEPLTPEEFQRQVRDEANEDYDDVQPTITAYGKTWPVVITPFIQARLSLKADPESVRPILSQIARIERKLRQLYPNATIEIDHVNNVGLSQKDKAEHDRLRDEQKN